MAAKLRIQVSDLSFAARLYKVECIYVCISTMCPEAMCTDNSANDREPMIAKALRHHAINEPKTTFV